MNPTEKLQRLYLGARALQLAVAGEVIAPGRAADAHSGFIDATADNLEAYLRMRGGLPANVDYEIMSRIHLLGTM